MTQQLNVLVYWSTQGEPIGEPIAAFWLFGLARDFCKQYTTENSGPNNEVVMIGEVEKGISTAVFRDGEMVSSEIDPLVVGEFA